MTTVKITEQNIARVYKKYDVKIGMKIQTLCRSIARDKHSEGIKEFQILIEFAILPLSYSVTPGMLAKTIETTQPYKGVSAYRKGSKSMLLYFSRKRHARTFIGSVLQRMEEEDEATTTKDETPTTYWNRPKLVCDLIENETGRKVEWYQDKAEVLWKFATVAK